MSNILIVGPSWVGDTIMAQTLFKLIKAQNSQANIDVLAPTWAFPVLSRMPEVRTSIEFPFGHGQLNLRGRWQFGKSLRDKYDQAIVLPNSFKSALVPWFARIPKRTGWMREGRFVLLNDARKLNKKNYPLMIEQYMALGLNKDETLPEKYPYPELDVTKETQKATLDKHQPIWRGKPIIAICAGAEFGPAKRWPENYYAEVANAMLAKGFDVWLFGSAKDKVVTEKIMTLTNHRCEQIAGRTVLTETIDLLSLVSVLITNDSGLMHIGAALKKPIIALYGSTSPTFTPPLSDHAQILKLNLSCQPCFARECPLKHHRCMQDLKPEQVLKVLSSWGY